MRHAFPVTRWVLTIAVLAGAIWLVGSLLTHRSPEDGPSAPPAAAAPRVADPSPALQDWEAELLAPDIQALWQRRRRQLDDLSHRYRAAPDSTTAEALRCSMETLIARSEREVYELRLAHARRAGQDDLVRRLERALADLRAGPGSEAGTTADPVTRPGGGPR
ncbi:hypothetical protein GF314_03205 [bacterium]|nr:hypothetical protein [bacterium]